LTAANYHDSKVFEELVEAVSRIRTPTGHCRKRPVKLRAYEAYDIPPCRRLTVAWLARHRRLAMRYERRADINPAFLTLE